MESERGSPTFKDRGLKFEGSVGDALKKLRRGEKSSIFV